MEARRRCRIAWWIALANLAGASIGLGSNITVLGSSNYQMASFVSTSMTKPMVVTGDAILYVTGNFGVRGSGYVHVLPGASLKLYIGGHAEISGGGVVNATGSAASFSYYGLPSNLRLGYTGSADLVGTVYAPQADVVLAAGAALYGACIANSISINPSVNVHYDESLAFTEPTR